MADEALGRVWIATARYGGMYEPGRWIAFAGLPSDVPDDWRGDDATCARFFEDRKGEVGGGDTPNEALADLERLLRERRRRLYGAAE